MPAEFDNLTYCVRWLAEERFGADEAGRLVAQTGGSGDQLFSLYRALVNVREPDPVPAEWLSAQDRMLQARIAAAGVTRADDLPRSAVDPRLTLWRGDITRIEADAIVNAANYQMLGCWVPGHHCIDNAIHTFAGVQLRAECARTMAAQGHEEPTGQAKVTGGYNLPAARVIHTVGPIAQGRPTVRHRMELARCYRSCLDAAASNGCQSLVFCCISTGIFGFPQGEAAPIAVRAVREWLDAQESDMHVIFDVFGDEDERIYHALLEK